jgi:drug/metabolite transporter (DMT)-like permease
MNAPMPPVLLAKLVAVAAIWGGTFIAGLSPLVATTYAALVGTAILVLACAIGGDLALPPPDAKVWVALGFLGVFGTAIAFVWFYDGVVAIGPARTGVFINLVPVFAVALGVLLLGERVEASMLAGGAIVVAGIWIINRPQPVSPPAVVAAH